MLGIFPSKLDVSDGLLYGANKEGKGVVCPSALRPLSFDSITVLHANLQALHLSLDIFNISAY